MSKKKTEDDAQANVVTPATIRDAMERLDSIKLGFQTALEEIESNGYVTLDTSNWKSSGENALKLLSRSVDSIWIAIGQEKLAAERLQLMQQKLKKTAQSKPKKGQEE